MSLHSLYNPRRTFFCCEDAGKIPIERSRVEREYDVVDNFMAEDLHRKIHSDSDKTGSHNLG